MYIVDMDLCGKSILQETYEKATPKHSQILKKYIQTKEYIKKEYIRTTSIYNL